MERIRTSQLFFDRSPADCIKGTWRFVVLVALMFLGTTASAQVRKYPATLSPMLGQPTSVYLSDYMAPGSNLLSAGIVFNDFNEPSWTFKLRVKIESADVRMETLPGFRPLEPIVVSPGVMRTLSGSDWEQYLNYNNLSISGLSVQNLIATGGRLPEGMYSFCFQVLDYDTGDPLSEEICRVVFIKLLEAPRINTPLCGVSLDPALTQHSFAWQLFDTPSPNAADAPQFQLTIWEVTDRTANIQTAFNNGQTLQVFQSDFLTEPTYAYGLADPPLELGKLYVYRVQALDPGGKDKYKNQGYSEFCSFYYGWPNNGKINLLAPRDGGGFRRIDIPKLRWSAVDSQLPGQEVSYEVRVVPMYEGQTKEQAIVSNPLWYEKTTLPAPTRYERALTLDKPLDVMGKYAWEIKAFSGQQQVGTSGVAYFNGPSLVEEFYTSIHRVEVDYLDGSNLNDLSGEGRIRFAVGENAWTPIRFEHIQLIFNGSFYVMTGGEFFYQPPTPVTVELNPKLEENGRAYFDIIRYRVNKDGIYVEGDIRWPLPIPALSNGVAMVKADRKFANFNNFHINTHAPVSAGTRFKLLEPFNFALNISTASFFYINNNDFWFDFNGTIELPDNVKGPMPGIVHFPYDSAEQLFYFEQDELTNPPVAPLAKSKVEMVAKTFTLDFSDQQSPSKFQSDPSWKGIYINDFEIVLNTSLDGKGQFDLRNTYTTHFVQPDTEETDAWISTDGLNLKFDITFPGDPVAMDFQSFPAHINRFKLDVDASQVVSSNSTLTGRFRIPVISPEEKFLFTVPVNNLGFDNGSLDNLLNTRFTHNPGSGDQELHMTVRRAVLSGFEKITMTVDLEWPSLGVTLTDLRGFNAWGDYSIGFDSKNGTVPLTQRMNASLSGYPITIGVIGAGSNNGTYVVATTADAGLGDDVSGGEGVPSINVYSVVANEYVPLEASGAIVESTVAQIPFESASAQVEQSYQQLGQTLVQNIQAEQERIVNEAEQLKNDLASTSSGTFYAAEDMLPAGDDGNTQTDVPTAPPGGGQFNSRQQEIIYEIARGFVEEMSRPLLDPIREKTEELNLTITTAVNGMVEDANRVIKSAVTSVVDKVADELVTALANDKVDVVTPINRMAEETTRIVSDEITGSLRLAVSRNVLEPVTILLKEQITGRVSKHIIDNGTDAVYAAITGQGGNAEDALEELINGAPDVLEAIANDVMSFVSLDNMRSTVDATASEFIKNINMNAVAHDLRKSAEEILLQAVADQAGAAISGLAEQYAADLGLGGFGIGGENPINFAGAANRLAQGDIKGVFAIDPVRVKLRTPVIDLDGFMKYTPEHPVYGDVWLGDIDMTIKVPKRFAFNAIYFNGRKDDIAYWFCQITPPESQNTPYELGKPLPKAAKPLADPVDIGVAKIVGASGRLYHHMKETPGNGIVPDASMRYGAYMHFVFFDKADNGKNLRLEVSGEINSAENGDYTIAFDGNLQMRSTKVEVKEPDKFAVVQGMVMIRYNSAEEHFLGYAKVVVNDPGKLCASASLLVDVKPGKWRVAIGTREDRIVFVPGCVGWSPTGWLDLNESTAELGLGVMYSGGAKSPNIDLGFVEFNVQMNAGIAFGIVAVVQYRPSFMLMQAGIWVDIWANLVANYKLPLKSWKSITLVEIYIRGDLVMIFNPPPTAIKGRLDGTCKIIGFKIDFSAKIDKQIG